ncbi:hypothetical protein B1R94_12955 [Mycolicibacterium litorale]|nr:hypothetical protein B1R94_12955 [Mycolicibacterium litorale]
MPHDEWTLSPEFGGERAYFAQQGNGVFRPEPSAVGRDDGMLSGPAVAALVASTLERKYGAVGFTPARLTMDLLKPARTVATRTQTRLIRHGQRTRTAECDVMQDDWIVARATLLQYRCSAAPLGEQWNPERGFTPPQTADGDLLYLSSDDSHWSPMGVGHHNAGHKRAYYRGPDAVAGLAATPFVRAVIVAAASTNLVTNLGSNGIGYLSGDLTVALTRSPRSDFIGVQADTRCSADGLSVGCATLFDEMGAFGTAMVTAMADPAARIEAGSGTVPVGQHPQS